MSEKRARGSDDERVTRISFGGGNGYLFRGQDGLVLVDTGVPGGIERIKRQLERIGSGWGEISLIAMTHTHYDHAGNVAAAKRHSGAPVVVQREEAEVLRSGRSGFPGGATPLGRLMVALAGRLRKKGMSFEPVEPDLLVDEEYDLHPHGFPGIALSTPSHSPGSMVLLSDDGLCFTGDIMFNLVTGRLYPPFADYPERLAEHWRLLLERGARTFYPGHGTPFSREKLQRALARIQGK